MGNAKRGLLCALGAFDERMQWWAQHSFRGPLAALEGACQVGSLHLVNHSMTLEALKSEGSPGLLASAELRIAHSQQGSPSCSSMMRQ